MTSRTPLAAIVRERTVLSEHLLRLVLDAPGLGSTGVPDEWLALTVPGQFQTRYYTVRALVDGLLTLDVVMHEEGLVTEWAQTDCVGDTVGISAPKGSFEPPSDAQWVVLAGDLTALPAMARISETVTSMPVTVHAETSDSLSDYFTGPVTWHHAPAGGSELAAVVRELDWPPGPGYFWMGGESAQMREIRRHLRHDLGRDSRSYDVMGYWSGSRGRQRRQVDPGPIYAAGKAAGKTDDQIWADYDEARQR